MIVLLDGEFRSGIRGLFVYYFKYFLVFGEVFVVCWVFIGCAVSGGDSRCLCCRVVVRCCEKLRLRERWCLGSVVKVVEGLVFELGWKRSGVGIFLVGLVCY